jgi:hypothetical protein
MKIKLYRKTGEFLGLKLSIGVLLKLEISGKS